MCIILRLTPLTATHYGCIISYKVRESKTQAKKKGAPASRGKQRQERHNHKGLQAHYSTAHQKKKGGFTNEYN